MAATRASETRPANGKYFLLQVAAVLVAAAIFWLVRIRHVLLGDGLAILGELPGAGGIHEYEPLVSLLQTGAFRLVRAFQGLNQPEWKAAWTSGAAVSIVAGALFVPLAWALAREIEWRAPRARDSHEAAIDPPTGLSVPRWAKALGFAVLISQGYIQLFCGYVENYAPLVVANGLVLLTGLRFIHGRGGLLASGAAMLLALGLHLSAAALLPAWMLMAVWGVSRGPARARAWRDLGLTALLFGGLTIALNLARPGFLLPKTLWDVSILALGQKQEDPKYLLSLVHFRDFVNEQLLIGPLGLAAFLGGCVAVAGRGEWRRPESLFAITAGAGYLLVCVLAGDSNLGYARNWDLLAPAGVIFTGAGLVLLRPLFEASRNWGNVLLLWAASSAFHTLPWIAVNASEARSIEWFENLPLGGGRTESTLGVWYMMHGRFDLAERWLTRSLEENPANTRAHFFLGELYLATGRPQLACSAFSAASQLRPDREGYRLQLARALAMAGRWDEARAIIEPMMRAHPNRASLWAFDGVLLRGLGQIDLAREAVDRAISLQPGDSLLARMRRRIESPSGLDKIFTQDLGPLVGF